LYGLAVLYILFIHADIQGDIIDIRYSGTCSKQVRGGLAVPIILLDMGDHTPIFR
jgi:hypothetical protein